VATEPCTVAVSVVQPMQILTLVGVTDREGQADWAKRNEDVRTKNVEKINLMFKISDFILNLFSLLVNMTKIL